LTVVCFVNQKGGVGKTASVVNIGDAMARLGQRVLLIDLDPQESLSYWLGVADPAATVYDLFMRRATLDECKIRHSSGLDIIPSQEMLATIQPDIHLLRQALVGQPYDFALLDCSPTLGMTTLAALTAAQWVMIPLCPDLLSIKGMSQLQGTIRTIQERTNPDLRLKGVIATRYSGRKKMHRHVLEQIQASLGAIDVFTVRDCIAVAESPVAGRSVLDYKPQSTGAQDYYTIARGLIHGKQ
jgi:chromosome partitioning protein